jgi:hypothetical protein
VVITNNNRENPNEWIFFGGEFTPFYKKYSQKVNSVMNSLFSWKQFLNKMKSGSKSPPKIAIIAYIMKGCGRFYTCIFWTLPNLAKFICGLSSLEQYHKIEKKNTDTNVMQFFVFWKKEKIQWVRPGVHGPLT